MRKDGQGPAFLRALKKGFAVLPFVSDGEVDCFPEVPHPVKSQTANIPRTNAVLNPQTSPHKFN
jgi:hypothetical protein